MVATLAMLASLLGAGQSRAGETVYYCAVPAANWPNPILADTWRVASGAKILVSNDKGLKVEAAADDLHGAGVTYRRFQVPTREGALSLILAIRDGGDASIMGASGDVATVAMCTRG